MDRTETRILLIDDSAAIRTAVESGLTDSGHVVRALADGQELARHLAQFQPDVVVLDVGLPGADGFALLELVRSRSTAGVVMLTARDGVDDRLRGLNGGADDYVIKPFLLPEFVARVNALLRRLGRMKPQRTVSDLTIDVDAAQVRRAGVPLVLTATEFKILNYFVENAGRVLAKPQILAAVWGFDAYDPNLVEVHISALRRKMEEHGPRLLHTARGLGYVLREQP